MKLDERLLPVVAAMKASRDPAATAAERRAAIEAGLSWVLPLIVTPGPELDSVTDEVTADGVPVRIYRPRSGVLPVLLYFHGGGFWELLEVPSLDAVNDYPSLTEFCQTFEVDMVAALDEVLGWYLGAAERSNPEISPMLAPLAGLPPAHVTTSDCDWLRDQGRRFADLLDGADVPVTYTNWMGTMHATADLDVLVPDISEAYLAETAGFLGTVFARVA